MAADPIALTLRYLHILFGIVWIGAVAYGVIVLRVAMGTVEPPARKAAMKAIIPRALQYLPGSAVMTILTGALLYAYMGAFNPDNLFGMAWGLVLLTALVLAILAFSIGMLFGVRLGKKILGHLLEEQCTHGPEVGGLQKRFNQSQFIVLGLGLAIISLMVIATTHALG